MKLGLILIIMSIYSKTDNNYTYEARNAQDTASTGLLHSTGEYNKGDTIIIK